MASYDIIKTPPKALTFDVFGTTVNWRTTVTETLINVAAAQLATKSADLPLDVRHQLSKMDAASWGEFAQEWRNSYKQFTKTFNPDADAWQDIDTHHHMSLLKLLSKWGLDGLFTADEAEDLSRVWHFLDPWVDSSAGLKKLNTKFVTSSLSNGNMTLQHDLVKHGMLDFQHLQSSEHFKAYKPHPLTYNGAARTLGVDRSEVAMVAAHLNDLAAARGCGFRTIYVERKQEEDWSQDSERYQAAKGWVDMWVREDEGGFVEVARRFGIV